MREVAQGKGFGMSDTELLDFAEYLLDIGTDLFTNKHGVVARLPNGERERAPTLRELLSKLKTQEEESISNQQ